MQKHIISFLIYHLAFQLLTTYIYNFYHSISECRPFYQQNKHGWIQRGGTGGPDPNPLKIHKNIGFPSNIDLDPLKITKPPSQHSMVGHYWHASETPFQWPFAGGPSGISILSPSHQLKKNIPMSVFSEGFCLSR